MKTGFYVYRLSHLGRSYRNKTTGRIRNEILIEKVQLKTTSNGGKASISKYKIQKRVIRIITHKSKYDSCRQLFEQH